jgi:hypothetical protein
MGRYMLREMGPDAYSSAKSGNMIDNAERRGWCVANSSPGKSHKGDP